ncbi:MAG: hypothetical protein RCG15_04055 [Candidatus Rickettsia vulgarisii]
MLLGNIKYFEETINNNKLLSECNFVDKQSQLYEITDKTDSDYNIYNTDEYTCKLTGDKFAMSDNAIAA